MPRRLLCCVVNHLMADHVEPIVDLLRGDDKIDIYLTAPGGARVRGATGHQLAQRLGVTHCGYFWSRFRWWDMIIFPEHRGPTEFHPKIDKVFIDHGLDSGKLFDGVASRYGHKRVLRQDNTPTFTRIFETSTITRDKAIAKYPALEDRIAIVGDLGADSMLQMATRRDELRREHGIAANEVVVLMLSTWGPQSLMEKFGEQIVAEASSLTDRYRFMFSTHPYHWQGDYAKAHPWGEYLARHESDRMMVIRPGDSWERFAVMTDMAISDHTSMGVKYALLVQPLIYLNQNTAEIVDPDSFGGHLRSVLPILDGPAQLEDVLRQAMTNYPLNRHKSLALQINACPGKAATRIKQEIYSILGLSMSI